MRQVHPNLFVGSIIDCPKWGKTKRHAYRGPTLHACKAPCWVNATGGKQTIPKDHPSYLAHREGNHLYLNIIDPIEPLFHLDTFTTALQFIDEHIAKGLLIHCNAGQSRAPSLALLWLAARGHIDNEGFWTAAADLSHPYPTYEPGKGLITYLDQNWKELTQ